MSSPTIMDLFIWKGKDRYALHFATHTPKGLTQNPSLHPGSSYPSCPMCAIAVEQLFISFHLGFCFCLALTNTNHIITMAILIVPKADQKPDPLQDSLSEAPEMEVEMSISLVPSADSFLACNPFFAHT